MPDLLIEIEGTKNQEEVYFQDIYLDDLPTSKGEIIASIMPIAKELDKIVVYISNREELLNLWEMPVNQNNCAQELLSTFEKLNEYVKKEKHES